MKTGEVAKILGVDAITVRRWIERDELKPFFSEGARGEHGATQRLLTEADILVLNTIRALRTGSNSDWSEIVVYLNSGHREQDFPQNAITVDPRTIPLPQAEQSARAMATLAERDAALARVNELNDKVREMEIRLTQVEQERDRIKEQLLREIADLNRQIGRLEGKLEEKEKDD